MANEFLKNLTNNISKAMRFDPQRGKPQPRKGLFAFNNAVLNKKQEKQFVMNSETLRRLANTDPITWSIRRTLKGFISNIAWDIVPDTNHIEAELDRWENMVIAHINPYGFNMPEFTSTVLKRDLLEEVNQKIDTILDDMTLQDTQKRERIRWIFNVTAKQVKDTAESHKYQVRKIFEHPNDTDTSFRLLLELLLDDILIYDAGALVKNYNYYGELAELYTIPGQEIKLYRNEDGTCPEAPEAAYAWESKGILRTEFTNDELLYFMQNPQHSGYGLSPLEVAAYIITASLYADEYNIDYFKHSNVPPGVLNLGENVTEDQRVVFQKLWENEVNGKGGTNKIVFAAGSDKLQFIPMRLQTNRDMQMMEYLKWTTSVKCACYGISPQDIGFVLDFHRTSAEVQDNLTKTRGVHNLLHLLASYFNEEIVKSEFKFDDVKFEWDEDSNKESIQQAQIDKIDLDSGVLNINERRKARGLKPIEGGDEYTIKGGIGMLPVSDLSKLNDQRIDPNTGMPGMPNTNPNAPIDPNAPLDPNSVAGQLGPDGLPLEKPGPEAEPQVDGEAGRPTLSEQKDKVNLEINRSISVKNQHALLAKTVDALKKNGINATLRIGFSSNDTTKK
jgi:HK97 family phage portal protein